MVDRGCFWGFSNIAQLGLLWCISCHGSDSHCRDLMRADDGVWEGLALCESIDDSQQFTGRIVFRRSYRGKRAQGRALTDSFYRGQCCV